MVEDFEETELEGVLIPLRWDDVTGAVAEIGISAAGERDFAVDIDTELGHDLMDYVGSRVRVVGHVVPGARVIVRRYEIVDSFDGRTAEEKTT